MWAPDVYEGAPTPVTAFLSTASKAAGFAALIRVFHGPIGAAGPEWTLLVVALAALTMMVGNLLAIPQTNIKRMLAYSGIAQAGYALVGLRLSHGVRHAGPPSSSSSSTCSRTSARSSSSPCSATGTKMRSWTTTACAGATRCWPSRSCCSCSPSAASRRSPASGAKSSSSGRPSSRPVRAGLHRRAGQRGLALLLPDGRPRDVHRAGGIPPRSPSPAPPRSRSASASPS